MDILDSRWPTFLATRVFYNRFLIALIAAFAILASSNLLAQGTSASADIKNANDRYNKGEIEEAIELLIPSAYNGHAIAQFNLAIIYAQDKENKLHQQESAFWLERAAGLGDAEAQFNLAMLNYSPDNTDRLDKVIRWLSESAHSGNRKAQYNLGYLSLTGLDVQITRNEGVKWLNEATARGDARAKRLVGLLLENRSDNTPKMYSATLEFRTEGFDKQFIVSRDGAEIYALPASRQTPIMTLKRGTSVAVEDASNNWLGVKVDGGFPAWIMESELIIKNKLATTVGLEANLYAKPDNDQQSVKIGVVTSVEELKVIEQRNSWVKVLAPVRFLAWIKESDVVLLEVDKSSEGQAQIDEAGDDDLINGYVAVEVEASEQNKESNSGDTITLSTWRPIYQDATTTSNILGVISEGTDVEIHERKDSFLRVSWIGGTHAWVNGRYFEISGDRGRASSASLRARVLPNTGNDAKVVSVLKQNQEFEVIASEGNWHQIVISPANSGWIENL